MSGQSGSASLRVTVDVTNLKVTTQSGFFVLGRKNDCSTARTIGGERAHGLLKREPAVDALLKLSGRKTFLRRPRAPSPLGDERASLPARWRAPARRSVRWRSRAPEVSAHALGAMPTTRLFGAPPLGERV
jgi:hypothetical protein